MSKLKICGLKTKADVEIINETQPDYCGFIVDYPKADEVWNQTKLVDWPQMFWKPSRRSPFLLTNPWKRSLKRWQALIWHNFTGKNQKAISKNLKENIKAGY